MITKEMTSAVSNLLVLSVLKKGPGYGYMIQREIKHQSEGLMDWTEGMLYPVLHRLEKQDMVEARWGVAENGRKRKYYYIKEEGREYLATGIDAWYAVSDVLIGMNEDE